MTFYKGLINKYSKHFAIKKGAEIITLNEGNTPLIKLYNIEKLFNNKVSIYAKYEGLNPTGSFKDRGMTVAVTDSVSKGYKAVICASTGNTSASAAAYSARANIRCFIIIPEGKIALGKLAQAMIYGSTILQISGNFDDGMNLVKEISKNLDLAVVNSINPYRIQGQKTIAFEIVDSLEKAPDFHCLPVGNAGNITAHWLGYREYYENKIIDSLPTMLGYQASGAAPFIHNKIVNNPETIATAIRIGNPQSWQGAWNAVLESKGWFKDFSDEKILQAQHMLAQKEGIFCEPASAASFAGALSDIRDKKIPYGSTVVCTLTGNGLKDSASVIDNFNNNKKISEIITLPANADALEKVILEKIKNK